MLFFDGSTGYLKHSARITSASYPISIVTFIAQEVGGVAGIGIPSGQFASAADSYNHLGYAYAGDAKYAMHRHPGGSRSATKATTPNWSNAAFRVMVAVFHSANSRSIYFHDATGVTESTAGTANLASQDQFLVGAGHANSGSVYGFFKGFIQEVHVYQGALTGSDVTSMLGGARPETLADWIDGWHLRDHEAGGVYTSIGGSRTMTAFGTVTSSTTVPNFYASGPAGDTTAPILSSPTGTQTGSTSGSGTVSTDEANGTLYYLATTNATETATTVKAGASQAVSGTGVQNVTFTGLTPSTSYYAHYVHRDAAGNDSTVASSTPAFTTTSGVAPTGTVTINTIVVGSTSASVNVSYSGSDHTGFEYRLDGGTALAGGATSPISVGGLTASTSYDIEVRAINDTGPGTWSTPVVNFTTAAASGGGGTPNNTVTNLVLM